MQPSNYGKFNKDLDTLVEEAKGEFPQTREQAIPQLAEHYLDLGNRALAKELLTLGTPPNNDARFWLATLHKENGELPAAIWLHEQAIRPENQSKHDSHSPLLHRMLLDKYLFNYASAKVSHPDHFDKKNLLPLLEQALKNPDRDPVILFSCARLYAENDRHPEAIELLLTQADNLENARKKTSSNPAMADCLEAAISLGCDLPHLAGKRAALMGDYLDSKAAILLEKIKTMETTEEKNITLHIAIHSLIDAISLNNASAVLRLADLYHHDEQIRQTFIFDQTNFLSLLEQAMKNPTCDPVIVFAAARLYAANNREAEAIERLMTYADSLEKPHKKNKKRNHKAEESNHSLTIANCLDIAIELGCNAPDILYKRAISLHNNAKCNLQDLHRAIMLLDRAFELDPSNQTYPTTMGEYLSLNASLVLEEIRAMGTDEERDAAHNVALNLLYDAMTLNHPGATQQLVDLYLDKATSVWKTDPDECIRLLRVARQLMEEYAEKNKKDQQYARKLSLKDKQRFREQMGICLFRQADTLFKKLVENIPIDPDQYKTEIDAIVQLLNSAIDSGNLDAISLRVWHAILEKNPLSDHRLVHLGEMLLKAASLSDPEWQKSLSMIAESLLNTRKEENIKAAIRFIHKNIESGSIYDVTLLAQMHAKGLFEADGKPSFKAAIELLSKKIPALSDRNKASLIENNETLKFANNQLGQYFSLYAKELLALENDKAAQGLKPDYHMVEIYLHKAIRQNDEPLARINQANIHLGGNLVNWGKAIDILQPAINRAKKNELPDPLPAELMLTAGKAWLTSTIDLFFFQHDPENARMNFASAIYCFNRAAFLSPDKNKYILMQLLQEEFSFTPITGSVRNCSIDMRNEILQKTASFINQNRPRIINALSEKLLEDVASGESPLKLHPETAKFILKILIPTEEFNLAFQFLMIRYGNNAMVLNYFLTEDPSDGHPVHPLLHLLTDENREELRHTLGMVQSSNGFGAQHATLMSQPVQLPQPTSFNGVSDTLTLLLDR